MLGHLRRFFPSRLQLPSVARTAGFGVLAYGAVAPLLAVAHEAILLGAALTIGDLAWWVANSGVFRSASLDPVYTSARLLTLGGIAPHGLAVAGPTGALLHERRPTSTMPSAMRKPTVQHGAETDAV